jgi:dipeptidase D
MASAIEGLKPERVWKYFAEIAKIPRCSGNEAGMTRYVLATAKVLGLAGKADAVGNVVVRKPPTPGHENVRGVVLQGHLDMVCEKNKDKVHDFSKDPIELVRKGDMLMADGTTLGADNGIAVATCLAIMEDRSLEHGPLEFLFTVNEETGLVGAKNINAEDLQGRILLNLDSEEEGELYVGCSGGADTIARWDVVFEDAPPESAAGFLKVSGLKGGHSGLEIDKGRGNAIKILNRVFLRLSDTGARLCSVDGGNKHNAIPREAEAVVYIPARKWDQAVAAVEKLSRTIREELGSVDPDCAVQLTELKGHRKARALKKSLQKKLCQTLSALPHGVIKMSADIPGLVETSTNLAVIKTGRKEITVATSQRSPVASEIDDIRQMVQTVFELGGADGVDCRDAYPGWKPNLDSEILKFTRARYQSMFGKEPQVKAVHAGLECGIIGERCPGMDMVSFGPTLQAVHSPDEKIYIDSVGKFWDFLVGLLKDLR